MDEEIKKIREQEDTELVKRVWNGDQKAFTELVKVYYKIFYSIALGIVHDLTLAEDIVQDGLMEIHNGITHLREPERFGSWGYTIIRRKAIKALRKMKTETKTMTQYFENEEINKTRAKANMESGQAHRIQDKKELVMRKLAVLPEKYRTIAVLYFFEQNNIPEIANRMGITERLAAVHLYRAKLRLRELVQDELL